MLISLLAAPPSPVEAQHWGMTHFHLDTRFLKYSMWEWDKKDFACEMGKLKRLKGQLALMEQDYLTEYQVRGRAAWRRASAAIQACDQRQ